MPRIVIYPYHMKSQTSRTLRDELGGLRVYPDRNYRPRRNDLIINWGNSTVPNWINRAHNILNRPESVGNSANKLRTFRILEEAGISIPRFTTSVNEAQEYNTVIVRNKLTGHSGEGIEVVENESGTDENLERISNELFDLGYDHLGLEVDRELEEMSNNETELPQAPLYTEYIKQKAEYRVHVFNGRVIDYIKKRRTRDDEAEGDESMIRSYNNGWIFTRDNLRRLDRVEDIAIRAVEALGLDFGGVDIVRGMDNTVYVIEVNSACGMEGSTLEKYLEAIREINHA